VEEIYHNFTIFPKYFFLIYYAFVFISFIYLTHKYGNDSLSFLIILIYYFGLFAYFGKKVENPYKILILILSVYNALKFKVFTKRPKRKIFIPFFILTVFFISSIIINGDYFNLGASQYSRYVIPFCFYFIFNYYVYADPLKFQKFNSLFYELLLIQIILSLIKLFIFGLLESIVGSVYYVGGALATILPILGFIFIWTINNGIIEKKDWLFIVGLLIIPIASMKRAIWFVMPVVLFLFMVYIPKKKLNYKYLLIILMLPIILYFGIRLNPTLNKEGKTWGSFDLNYAIEYSLNYSFGKEDVIGNREEGQGRGGATIMLLNKLFTFNNFNIHDFFGFGLNEFYTKDYSDFDVEKYGVNHKGAVTGFFQNYISTGYLGVISFLIYILILLFTVRHQRIRIALFLIFSWEYFFYPGVLFREPALSVLFVYILVYISYNGRISFFLKNDTLNNHG
jgi:hypothetical protein